tara:strand:+ start:6360 stop:6776 length:417 start_codon:yes stop_codon:yes gene_type:complete
MLIKKEAIVLKDIDTVFNIVNRVDLYKNFIPYCIESKILNENSTQMQAKLDFDIKGIKTSFSTENQIKKNEFIKMKLIEGPFKYLDGEWSFKQVENKTIIYLNLNYEAKNKIIEFTVGKSLEKITNILVKSFVDESLK